MFHSIQSMQVDCLNGKLGFMRLDWLKDLLTASVHQS